MATSSPLSLARPLYTAPYEPFPSNSNSSKREDRSSSENVEPVSSNARVSNGSIKSVRKTNQRQEGVCVCMWSVCVYV